MGLARRGGRREGGDIGSTCCVPHRGADIHGSYRNTPPKLNIFFAPTILSCHPTTKTSLGLPPDLFYQNAEPTSSSIILCEGMIFLKVKAGFRTEPEHGAEQRYLTMVSCAHSLPAANPVAGEAAEVRQCGERMRLHSASIIKVHIKVTLAASARPSECSNQRVETSEIM